MCPMIFNQFADGPTMVLSPPQEHTFAQFPSPPVFGPPSGNLQSYAPNPTSFTNGVNTNSPATPDNNSSWTLNSSSSLPKPSRKRSRDESFDESTDASSVPAMPAPAPPQEEPIYGEGMVLLNPQTGMALSAESQTGTWYEETSENANATAPPVSSRSNALSSNQDDIPGRKSQRLDHSAPGLDDIALSSIHQRLQHTNDDNRRTLNPSGSSPFSQGEPLVDDATRLLGISWQRIGNDDDMAAAVRGWKKFIDNQYSTYLHDSHILMKNRALNAYLVSAHPIGAASPAFYLFTEDLTQAQLVGSSWEITLQNLRTVPVAFEGTEVLQAGNNSLNHPPQNTIHLSNPSDEGLPLLQTLSAMPATNGMAELNAGVAMSSGMEVDA